MRYKLIITTLILALIASACNLPSGNDESTGEGLIYTLAAQTLTAAASTQASGQQATEATATTDTTTSAPTDTQAAPAAAQAATSTPICNLASFVSDVTIKDDTEITVNSNFTKTWKLKNVGTCTWTSGYSLVFDSGDKMGGTDSQQLTNSTVGPGQTIDVSVDLKAPGTKGTYKGNWKLKDPNGVIFGLSTGPFWVQIKAVAAGQAGWPTFKNGNSGPEIYAIQYLLKARGYTIDADGIWGPQTQARVEDFQTDNGLTEDVVAGTETLEALVIQVSQGKTGLEVRAAQYLLKNKFGYNIAVDGIFGPDTATAVKSFQTSKGLASDGIVGPNTWKALFN